MLTRTSILLFLILCGSSELQAGSFGWGERSMLLNDDHGLLTQNDFLQYTSGLNVKKYNPKRLNLDYVYWQCFGREKISLSLIDTGYQSSEVGGKDTVGRLQINVSEGAYRSHHYGMRANWPVLDFQQRFMRWRKLMNGQSVICLAGRFVDKQFVNSQSGHSKVIYAWVFEALKTKKGIDSYF